MGKGHVTTTPSVVHGGLLQMAALACGLLQRAIIAGQRPGSPLRAAVGRARKGRAVLRLYLVGIGAAMWRSDVGLALHVAVPLMWRLPDRRIERTLHARPWHGTVEAASRMSRCRAEPASQSTGDYPYPLGVYHRGQRQEPDAMRPPAR